LQKKIKRQQTQNNDDDALEVHKFRLINDVSVIGLVRGS
jgi:hypothetical protein